MDDRIKEMENLVEELSNELAEGFYQTVQVLSNIVSIFDVYYEGSHSRFVSQKSAQIAQILGMTETEIYEIKIAGLLHDIGKVGLNDAIWWKFPAEMTGNEYQKYMMHPIIGKKILSDHKGFSTIGEIILQHHERIDGSGFPNHLKGQEISPQASIIGVVDTYHASVYKKQKQTDTIQRYSSALAYLDASKSRFVSTMNYLHNKSKILFDKTVVEVFTEIIEAERRGIGEKTIMRLPVTKLKPNMVIAEDVKTNYGLVLCYSGEELTDELIEALIKNSRWHEIPPKVLVMT